jgi:type III secretion protein J
MSTSALGRALLAASLLGLLAGCESEVQHGLTEKDANDIRVALSKHGIPADKKREEGGQTTTWMILVPKGEVNRATEVLVTNHLPPEHQPGLAKTYEQASMVPGATEDKARYIGALQGELASTLESVDGVLSARVNVNIPEQSDLDDRSKRPQPSAAVVITYSRSKDAQGNPVDKPPVTEEKIKALVARAIPDLVPANVEVALTPANLPGGDTGGEAYVDLAGLRMSTDSVMTFKTMASVAIVAILALACWVGMLYWRSGQSAPARPTRRGVAPDA